MFLSRMRVAASSQGRNLSTSALYRNKCQVKPLDNSFKKVMVANRGEIAIRVFRALTEMNIRSVAVYAFDDRHSLHRQKADEAYEIGSGKTPVAAYLDIPSIIKIATEHKVDAIHPGYGFLSERADFAAEVEKAGITFIGPSPAVMARMGDKVAARRSAIEAGVPVVPGTDHPITTADEAVRFAEEYGTPIILKAAYGGGGRGMRRVDNVKQVSEAFEMASREALANFGNGSMFVEKFVENPRHIEVQLMGDNHGNVIHLFERDCSVQRRHQKVVEIAPAPHLAPEVRQRLLDDAVKIANFVGYQNAGTVEFLLDKEGKHFFIEVNARLQVEHTVTEEVTGVDLVQTQIRVAEGRSLNELGLEQKGIKLNGAAIQCRLTTEDPTKAFQPDSGTLEVYRTGEGMGIRIDGAAYDGCRISPYYDSLLCKIISHASSHEEAVRKLARSLSECRIRGVKINKPFVLNVLRHKDFVNGTVDTSFIDKNPQLLEIVPTKNRGMRLLNYLAEVKVNGSLTPLATKDKPAHLIPTVPRIKTENQDGSASNRWFLLPTNVPLGNFQIFRNVFKCPSFAGSVPAVTNWRNVLITQGQAGFQKKIREHKGLLLTDTTFRDAHQSLLATRVRTHDLLKISPFVSNELPQLFSLENWGGATFDVCMKFLRECPWERLALLREQVPNIPFQCLLRGANAMGYQNYPDNVIEKFCKLSTDAGMDIFRIFDCLNYVPNMMVGIDAVKKAGGVVEAAIAYTGDITDKNRTKYNLQYYLDLADQLAKADIHILAIKDMAGVLKPAAAKILIGELRSRYPHLPIHLHMHDTAGVGVATILAASEAGVDIVDVAVDSMSGMTSQPSMGAVVHSLRGTERDTGLDIDAHSAYNTYWEQTRRLYAPFECTTTMRSGNADVFKHEIPGGQYTNLQFQSVSLNLQDQFNQVTDNYHEANIALGDIIKVTPSSKVTGDLAQVMTQNNIKSSAELLEKADSVTFPSSVVQFFEGKLGQPPYGFPKELREKVLRGKSPMEGRPGAQLKPLDMEKVKKELEDKLGMEFSDFDVMSSIMFPAEFEEMVGFRDKYGPVDKLPTNVFFTGPPDQNELTIELEEGKNLLVKFVGLGEINEKGEREVHFEFNGHYRNLFVKDKESTKGTASRVKALKNEQGQIGAPMKGTILDVKVKVGDKVSANQTLCVLSAMKMEMAVESKIAGIVSDVILKTGETVEAEDLIIIVKAN